MSDKQAQSALVDSDWLESHTGDPGVKLIEIAGMGQEQMQAYKAGHIPGAACWKWKDMLWDARMRDFPAPDEFARRLGATGISNDTTVVFYGEDIQFGIYAWWTFMYCGHTKVRVLDGARYRWQAQGRKLSTEEPVPAEVVNYRPVERNEAMRIRRDEVLATLGKPGTAILDGRSPEEYSGQRVGGPGGPDVGAVRAGRIPGAQHLFYEDLLNADKSFKPTAQLREYVMTCGAEPDREILAYCRMSHRATVLYFVLTQLLGYPAVRLYDGSWTEWGNLVGVPVER
jgi:thiosulfate/3-mercaptopyruvate sulfurtransferase